MILYNGESLAYLGDAIYEVNIRKYLLLKWQMNVNKLHSLAIKYTSGDAQAKIMNRLLKEERLTEDEISYFKRGRNSHHSKNRRNIKVIDYKMATGFESLIGYLYLSNQLDRLDELIKLSINMVEEDFYGAEKE